MSESSKFDPKPTIVLTLISTIVCALLVVFYHLTYVDTTGVITDKLQKGLDSLYGAGGSYEMVLTPDGNVVTFDGVTSVIVGGNGETAFEVITKGYSKDGLHLLIAVEDGAVKGIAPIAITDTPGLGNNADSYLSSFAGVTAGNTSSVDNVSGATYSSKGVKNAVETALSAYAAYMEGYSNG